MNLTRRNFLFALTASVVAAGAPLPVGVSLEQWGQSIVALPEVKAAQWSLNALMASNGHMIKELIDAGICRRGETVNWVRSAA